MTMTIPEHPGAFVVYFLKSGNPNDKWRLRRPNGSVASYPTQNDAWRAARIGASVAKAIAIKYCRGGWIINEENCR